MVTLLDVEENNYTTGFWERYNPREVLSTVKKLTWVKLPWALKALLLVISLTVLMSLGIHYLDLGFSGIVLEYFSAKNSLVLDALQAVSALLVVVFAFKLPSPGDTIASIFGGEITAQGSGLTPREKKLLRLMSLFTFLFLLASVIKVIF